MKPQFLARLSTANNPSTFKGPIDSFLLAKSYSILIASVKVLAWESSWTERAKKCIYDWFFLKFNHNYLKIPVAILLARCQSTFLQLEIYVTVKNCFFHATETLLPEIAKKFHLPMICVDSQTRLFWKQSSQFLLSSSQSTFF